MGTRMPWERRLEDLAHLLQGASRTYFDPDLFRRNTNQFLQTARTVTFIIQKNKGDIPDFKNWYQSHVLDAWRDDAVMGWAKDARNVIEKEGDLEFNSALEVALIYSYDENEDVVLPCSRTELLEAGVKKLIRLAEKHLPSGLQDVAGLKITRCWVTASLPGHELLQSLGYTYARLFDCCDALARHLGRPFPKSISEPSEILVGNDLTHRVEMVKLRDRRGYKMKTGRISPLPDDKMPDFVREFYNDLKVRLGRPTDYDSAVEFYASMAEATFQQWGNHLAMLYFLSDDWTVQYMVMPVLADQTDKYFFWRQIAEKVRIQKPRFLVHICEIWVRDLSKHSPGLAMRELPIKGECLQLAAFERGGSRTVITWDIHRTSSESNPTLSERNVSDDTDRKVFFFMPAMRAMGLEVRTR
jgi:hypothetical protein